MSRRTLPSGACGHLTAADKQLTVLYGRGLASGTEFRVLGSLEVWREGRALNLGGTRQRAVLAQLLLHANESVSTDVLIDGLWADEPPADAAAALQAHVS